MVRLFQILVVCYQVSSSSIQVFCVRTVLCTSAQLDPSCVSGFVHLLTDQRIPGPVSCRSPEPRWFVGDPTSLAHDNIHPICRKSYQYENNLYFSTRIVTSKGQYFTNGTIIQIYPKCNKLYFLFSYNITRNV